MSRGDDRPRQPLLQYQSGDPATAPRRRSPLLLAIGSFIGALAAFPLGAATSAVLMDMPRVVSRSFADRAGFMLFAAGAGAACAVGCLAFVRARRLPTGAGRAAAWIAMMGILLGGFGSAGAVALIIFGAIR